MNTNPTGFTSPQAIAEDKVLEFFRESGVFTPPSVSHLHPFLPGIGIEQSVNFENMIVAAMRMYRTVGHGDPRYIQRILIKCLEENIV